MWPSKKTEHARLVQALQTHSQRQSMPGIQDPLALETLATQIIASLRREAYYKLLQRKQVAARRADPNDPKFDAERAVAHHIQSGNIDEAAWLVFLMTCIGRPADTGWLRLRDVYGKLGTGTWDWASVSLNPATFTTWLSQNWTQVRGKFGNHRKYESLRPNARRNLGTIVENYVAWVGSAGHTPFFAAIIHRAGNDPNVIFDALYKAMTVPSFGRLSKFDYLSLLGRYSIVPIVAGSAYLQGATGPLAGARLLFDGKTTGTSSENALQAKLDLLEGDLGVGMAVLEDALCNWQKSPRKFVHFKG